jgi:hypothetical protein
MSRAAFVVCAGFCVQTPNDSFFREGDIIVWRDVVVGGRSQHHSDRLESDKKSE